MIGVPKFSNCDWQPKLPFQPWLPERLWTNLKQQSLGLFWSSASSQIVDALKTPIAQIPQPILNCDTSTEARSTTVLRATLTPPHNSSTHIRQNFQQSDSTILRGGCPSSLGSYDV
ncbi:hypothetical protein RSAG8_03961, partial [Rhizoctonia solani AG-8 WAC10335]